MIFDRFGLQHLEISALLLLVSPITLPQTAPAEVPAREFARLPMLKDAEISPDGTHIAYLRPVDGRDTLMIQEIGTGDPPAAIPPAESADFSWLRWGNRERLVFAMRYSGVRGITETGETRLLSVDRNDFEVIKIVRPATREVTGRRLGGNEGVRPPPQIQDRIVHWLPEDPDRILVAIDDDFDTDYSVRRIDIDSGIYRDVVPETANVQRWVADQNGVVRLGLGYSNDEFKMRVMVGDDWTDAKNTDWYRRGYWPDAFTEDPDVVLMSGPDDNGYEVIRKVRLSDGVFLETVAAKAPFDVGGLVMDPVTLQPAGFHFTDGLYRVEYFDPVLRGMQASLQRVYPDASVEIKSMSADRKRVLVYASSPMNPGVSYLWDRNRKQISVVAESYPGLKPELLSAPRRVSYEARDGTSIPAYLTVPKGVESRNLPIVVLPHGGPTSRSDANFWFLTQFLASRGYAVLEPNFRGSRGYGRQFMHAGRNQWGGLMQDDVTDAARWLISEGIADAQRMCVVGWSYGGYAAAMAAVTTQELFRCAVSINGVLNLDKYIADSHKYVGGNLWSEHIGLSGESAKAVSPYHLIDDIGMPMLIIQARDDVTVHVDHAIEMAEALEKREKEHALVLVDFGGHSMRNEGARLQILESMEVFLKTHIGQGR